MWFSNNWSFCEKIWNIHLFNYSSIVRRWSSLLARKLRPLYHLQAGITISKFQRTNSPPAILCERSLCVAWAYSMPSTSNAQRGWEAMHRREIPQRASSTSGHFCNIGALKLHSYRIANPICLRQLQAFPTWWQFFFVFFHSSRW